MDIAEPVNLSVLGLVVGSSLCNDLLPFLLFVELFEHALVAGEVVCEVLK